ERETTETSVILHVNILILHDNLSLSSVCRLRFSLCMFHIDSPLSFSRVETFLQDSEEQIPDTHLHPTSRTRLKSLVDYNSLMM
uniref:Uncharacterized protein n=1 Tax=Xiphophorus maculatus TaxID=8083 RepID=A0A3B5R8A4_XIPMA